MKKKGKLFFITIILTLTAALIIAPSYPLSVKNVKAAAEPVCPVNTSASAMAVIESSTRRVLYSHNMHQRRPNASTTKILTAITVIENANVNDIITVPPCAVGVEGSSMYLDKGEKISVLDLLYGLMLRSGNDAAVALAMHTAGSLEKFAELMNKTAKKAGAINSNFVTPHGLHHDEHYTTAYDLAMISAYAMENPLFAKIAGTKNHTATWDGRDYKRYMTNKNKILTMYEGGNGIKTGFTKKAGRCLVSSACRNGMQVICVVLNCGPMFEECMQLMSMAFENYPMREIANKDKPIGSIGVKRGQSDAVKIATKDSFYYPLEKSEFEKLRYEAEIKPSLCAPVRAGKKVGKIKVYLDNQLLFSTEAVTIESVAAEPFYKRFERLLIGN